MKRCRTCNRKYTDETYEYCVDDGTPLSGAFDVDATGNETSDVTSGTHKQKKKPRKNFINDPVIAISVNEILSYAAVCNRSILPDDPSHPDQMIDSNL